MGKFLCLLGCHQYEENVEKQTADIKRHDDTIIGRIFVFILRCKHCKIIKVKQSCISPLM